MAYLDSSQRNLLEKAVVTARKITEAGAKNALIALAVNNSEPFGNMSSEQKILRNHLRHKGRLLGDILIQEGKAKGEQSLDNLSSELAYEYWHKMLFAKFLEVNNLLMHPSGVSVSMSECEELASEEEYLDKWHAASFYASKMLPAIFRPEDPLMSVEFATEDRIKLERLLESIPDEIYKANDSLGWVYQFWQSEAKARINASGDKIDGEKLPAVTQLFTEPYMVHFLIDNTVGAWWVCRNPDVTPPVKFEYLRTLEDGKPAAGGFEGWPGKTADITSLDPCMGSGHFIVSLFEVFVNLRMYEENLSKEDATDKVIKDNLYGLEIDPRCTQLAAFNLALTAWKFCGKYKELPEMNLACSGIAPKGKKEDWVRLVGNVRRDDQARMENGMKVLYDHFQLAPELGSLLDPSMTKADTFTASFEELQPILTKALENERDTEQLDRGVMAAGIAKAGKILSNKYYIIITNVPYLGSNKMSEVLYSYGEMYFSNAKSDLSTMFIEKSLKQLDLYGRFSFVTTQNWMQIKHYEKFRKSLINYYCFSMICNLGKKAFRTTLYDFNVCLLIMSNDKNKNNIVAGIDLNDHSINEEKFTLIKLKDIIRLNQNEFLKNPLKRILLIEHTNSELIEQHFNVAKGSVSGDKHHYIKYFWETNSFYNYRYWLDTPSEGVVFSGRSLIIHWIESSLFAEIGFALRGEKVLNKQGIAISKVNRKSFTIYEGTLFDDNVAVISPKDDSKLESIFEFVRSGKFNESISKLDSKLGITAGTFGQVNYEGKLWDEIAKKKYPYGLPEPYSEDQTQWLFHGNPIKADNPLQVAVARFLGYRWPAESETEMKLSEEARYLINEITKYDAYTDNDGIVCIPPVNGELTAADRLRDYLAAIYGSQWSHNTIEKLLKKEGSRSKDLENYLRDEFFEQHFKLFQNRPFIWQIWDGRKDGFSVLVNYHKLTKEALQKIIYTYLGDWIRQCEAKLRNNESGAEGLLIAAQILKTKLELILEGEKPYDIFVRWKPIDKQPVGWDPDLNDGVRLNIRPFVESGVLRKQPKIKWGIDRGKNPPGSPWGEIRDNDIHLTLREKLEAREKSKKKTS